ncbi:MAG: hypothetical protein JO300_13675 [Silvibacterium sp.]|nr:hypothetical protein [Silvibacterium sp.]MBV8437412.1 hypothetical protein [Silvibacterium sp.]
MSSTQINLNFPHCWSAEILPRRPLILPNRQFLYPKQAEDIERGALEVMVHPADTEPFLATFALGFSDPTAPTGLWSCPDPDWLCAVAGGYAYVVNTSQPRQFEHIEYRPVLLVRVLRAHGLLIFVGHHSLLAWGAAGKAWQTGRLSSEGIEITHINGDHLEGIGWDLIAGRDVPFRINLRTGARVFDSGQPGEAE